DVVRGGVVVAVVHAHDDRDVLALGRGGDDHLLGTGLDVLARVVGLGEAPSGLDHDVRAEIGPRQRSGIPLGQHADLLVAGPDDVARGAPIDVARAQHRVVFQQVRQGRGVGQVVGCDNFDAGCGAGTGVHSPPEVAPDAAEAV